MGQLTDNADGSLGIKVCYTQQMLEQMDTGFFRAQDQGCTYKKGLVVGGTQSFSYTCAKPVTTGDGKLSVRGGTSYALVQTMESVMFGKAERMTTEFKGQWLGPSCGAIKPQ